MQFKLTTFEVKRLAEDSWQEIPEKMFLEKLLACFDPITPALTKMLQGGEITASQEIYRTKI
jgi:hypothetical protein